MADEQSEGEKVALEFVRKLSEGIVDPAFDFSPGACSSLSRLLRDRHASRPESLLERLLPDQLRALFAFFLDTGECGEVLPFYLRLIDTDTSKAVHALVDEVKWAFVEKDAEVIEKVAWRLAEFLVSLNRPEKTVELLCSLAQVYHGLLALDKAVAVYRKSLQILSTHASFLSQIPILRQKLLDFYITIGDFDGAEAWLDSYNSDPRAKSRLYMKTWQVEKAETALIRLFQERKAEKVASGNYEDCKALFDFYVSIWEYEKATAVLLEKFEILQSVNKKSTAFLSCAKDIIAFCKQKYQYEAAERGTVALESPLDLADFYVSTWEYSKAESVLQSLVAALQETKPVAIVALVESLLKLASVCKLQRKEKQAMERYREAVGVCLSRDCTSRLSVFTLASYYDFCRQQSALLEQEATMVQVAEMCRGNADEEVRAREELANFYVNSKQDGKAEQCLTAVFRIRQAANPLSEQTVAALRKLADFFSHESRKNVAKEEEARKDIVRIRTESNAPFSVLVEARNQLADFYSRYNVKLHEKAEDTLKETIEMCKERNPVPNETAMLYGRLDDFYRKTKQVCKIESSLQSHLSLQLSKNPSAETTLKSRIKLGDFYCSQHAKNDEKAREMLASAWELRKLRSESAESVRVTLGRLCDFFIKNNQKSEAERTFLETLYGDNCKLTLAAMGMVDSFYWKMGSGDRTEAALLELIQRSRDSGNSPVLAEAYEKLSAWYLQHAVGDRDRGEKAMREFVEMHRSKGAASDSTISALKSIRRFYAQTKETEKEESAMQEIADILQSKAPFSDPHCASLQDLATFYAKTPSSSAKLDSVHRTLLQAYRRRSGFTERYVSEVGKVADCYQSPEVSRSDKAEEVLLGLERAGRLLSPASKEHVSVVLRLVSLYVSARSHSKAEELLRSTVNFYEKAAPFSPPLLTVLERLAELYESQSDFPRLEHTLQSFLSYKRKISPFSESMLQLPDRICELCTKVGQGEQLHTTLFSLRSRQDAFSSATIDSRRRLIEFYMKSNQLEVCERVLLDWIASFRGRMYERPTAMATYRLLAEVYSRRQLTGSRICTLKRLMALVDDKESAQKAQLLSEILKLFQASSNFHSAESMEIRAPPSNERLSTLRRLYSK